MQLRGHQLFCFQYDRKFQMLQQSFFQIRY